MVDWINKFTNERSITP